MNRLLALSLLLLTSACSQLSSRAPAELHPVPRSPIEMAATITRSLEEGVDEEPFFDAEEEARLDSLVARTRGNSADVVPHSTFVHGLLRDRFSGARLEDEEARKDDKFSRVMARSGAAEPRIEWVLSRVVEDSLDLGREWAQVRRTWRRDHPVMIAEIVWPTPVRIIRKDSTSVQVVTDWIEGVRVPLKELRCLSPTGELTERAHRVRLVGALVPGALSGVRIRGGIDVDSPYPCGLSPSGEARVSAFVRDLWLAAYRLASEEVGSHLLHH